MAYVIPNTTCKLYSGVEAIPGEQNLYFSSVANKNAYFNNKLVLAGVNMTYQRKGLGRLRIEADIATVRRCNYISFVNTNHENVVFYAFIFDYEYINEGCTEVSYIIDEWLTNCHDANMTFSDCVIEREHNNLAEYNAERANPYRNDMPSLVADEPMTVSKEMELPAANPVGMILDEFNGLDTKYSWSDYGPFGVTDTQVVTGDNARNCFVILFAGEFETEQQNSILRVMDYLYACRDNQENNAGWTLNPTVFENSWFTMPEIFKMFSWFDIPRRFKDGANCMYYVGILDPVDGPLTGQVDSSDYVTYMGKQSGQYISNIMNWFTMNDAVGTILGLYTLPKWMVKSEPNFVTVSKPESPSGFFTSEFMDQYTAENWVELLKEAGWEMVGTTWYYINDVIALNENAASDSDKVFNWYYDVTSGTVKAVAGSSGTYALSKNGDNYFVDRTYNASLPEVIDDQSVLNDHDGYNIKMPVPVADVENYKLKRAPFSYLRATTPDNNSKEYYFEDFYDLVNANSIDFTKQSNGAPTSYPVKFRCVTCLNGQPKLSLVPVNYKYFCKIPDAGGILGMLTSDLYELSPDERLEFTGFPQLGFITDGYIDYLSSQYNEANANKSVEARAAYNHKLTSDRLGNAKELAGNVGDIISGSSMIGAVDKKGNSLTGQGVRQIAQSVVNLPSTIENMRYTEEANHIYKQRMAEADMRGQFNGTIYDTLYNGTKHGFVGDYYKAGDSWGFSMYQFSSLTLGMSQGIKLQMVTLKPAYLALYDNFLTNYGYAVNRIGLPHVYEAIKGMAGKTLKFNSKNFVYVKTSECKVSGLIYESCKQIADMFNNGIKFINGDPS